MTKTILGIILFLAQIGLALFYNPTIDLIYIVVFAALAFAYILYKHFTGKYNAI